MKCIRVNHFEEIETDWLRLFYQETSSPFQSLSYIKLFSQNFCNWENVYILKITDNKKVVAILALEKIATQTILIGMKPVLGKEEITDYGDIIVASDYQSNSDLYLKIWKTVFLYLKTQQIDVLQLDYLKQDSLIFNFFNKLPQANIKEAEVAPFINLNQSWDSYLTSLKRVERKELKRKIKRLEIQNFKLVELDYVKKEDFDDFIRLHRLSDDTKEKFMSEEMASFFWQVSQINYSLWKAKLWFLEIDNKKVAAIMGFISDNRLLMYNSGFDPAFSYYSVGLLSHALIMQKYFNSKYQIYDFMRGSERYKYDLGAKNLQLYRVNLNLNSF